MDWNRRDFLKGTAWMGATALAAGCVSGGRRLSWPSGAPMQGFRAKPMPIVRVGFIGVGGRGRSAVGRVARLPGVKVTAVCDVRRECADLANAKLKEVGRPAAKAYVGEEAYKAVCDAADVDVVYIATDWAHHAPFGLYALRSGKHALIEVPAAMYLDECWELVETAEEMRLHCMQLENCVYGEMEMLGLQLVRQGVLGKIVHGECGYIHDLRVNEYEDGRNWDYWRLKWNLRHRGNQYPTHGLGPIAWYMDINRGDRFDYLVSLENGATHLATYAREHFPADSWKNRVNPVMADVNTTLIRTAQGKSITVVHDVSSPRPYSRINFVQGTKGCFWGYPCRAPLGTDNFQVGFEEDGKTGVHTFFDRVKAEQIRCRYRHPLWQKVGEIARKIGGHGGMDFIMDLRWAYCLQNGLPLDQDVYDLALWCSICELSERSVRQRSMAVDIPDFTRGAWKTARPLPDFDVDLKVFGIESQKIGKDDSQLNV